MIFFKYCYLLQCGVILIVVWSFFIVYGQRPMTYRINSKKKCTCDRATSGGTLLKILIIIIRNHKIIVGGWPQEGKYDRFELIETLQ